MCYVQCDIEVPEKFRETSANFAFNFKNNVVARDDICPFLEKYAEKEGLLTQPRRMLTSSHLLKNGTAITPLLPFYVDAGLVFKKNYRFVQYTPMKSFNIFVQSAVNSRKAGDENPISSVVAETIKLLAIHFYGYRIMDRIRQSYKICQ